MAQPLASPPQPPPQATPSPAPFEPQSKPNVEAEAEGAVVEVRARRAQAAPPTASGVQLSPREVHAAPHRDAEEILRQIPGLTLTQHGSEGKGRQYFLRGFDAIHGADLALSVEGVPLNEWSNIHGQGYLDLGLLLPELVTGVTALKGPFALDQGAFAMAGSADYQLGVEGLSPRRDVALAYTLGSGGRQRALLLGADAAGATWLGLAWTQDPGFGARRALRAITLNGHARLLDGPTRLEVLALGHSARFELPGLLRDEDVRAGRVGLAGAYDDLGQGAADRGLLILKLSRGAGLGLTLYGGQRRLSLRENFTGDLFDPIHGDLRAQTQRATSAGGALRGAWGARPWQLKAALGGHLDILAQRERRLGRALEEIRRARDLTARQWTLWSWAGLRWRPNRAVEVEGGLRGDGLWIEAEDLTRGGAPGALDEGALSPRLTARWRLARPLWLLAAYGRGQRPPEARAATAYQPSHEGLGDEVIMGQPPTMTVSDAIEIGARFQPSPWLDARVAAFATWIERESIFDHVSGLSMELNGTRRLGAEAVIATQPRPWLDLSVELTGVDARFQRSERIVPYAPRWVYAARLVAGAVAPDEGGWRGGLRFLGWAPRALPHGATGATMASLDATLSYHAPRWWLGLELENALGLDLREGEYHYASHWRAEAPADPLPALHISAGPPLNLRLTLGGWL